jgi:protein gp37
MGIDSKIEWTDHTINFWWGCEKVSPGCANCYAADQSKRLGEDIWGPGKPRKWIRSAAATAVKLNQQAAKSGIRQKVFCQSMADFFEEDHGQPIVHLQKTDDGMGPWAVWHRNDIGPCTAGQNTVNHSRGERPCTLTDLRNYAFRLIDQTPWLDWQIVTKRPENIRRMWPCYVTPPHRHYRENVWLLTSVENQEQAEKRIPELLKCRDLSPVLGLSMEPLLGPVSLRKEWMDVLKWVIVGGESGPHARPLHLDWARSLRDQCLAAGVPFFFKQWGEYTTAEQLTEELYDAWQHFATSAMKETDLYRFGKKRAGRLLDGVEWSQFPQVN